MRFEMSTPVIGAEVTGIDLNASLSPELADEIHAALVEYNVLFFRDQHLEPISQIDMARQFGEIERPHPLYPTLDGHPEIVKLHHGPHNAPDTDGWHTDLSFRARPPFASVLAGQVLPPCGGDTLWLSLSAAYDSLPTGLRSEVEQLQAVHDLGDFRNNFATADDDGEALVQAHQRFGSAVHPIVRTHPVSGRKFLYVNEGFTQHVVGWRAADSRRLLNLLFRHIEQPEHQVRFRWSPGAVAMWDNRCTSHYALSDYLPHERVMHRITLVDDRRSQD